MTDFFISYTQADLEWAEWIVWVLEEGGYRCEFQARDSRPGENLVSFMHRAMTQSERTLAVLSKAYLESDFAPSEWSAAFMRDPRGEAGVLLPVRVEDFEPPGVFSPLAFINLVGLDEVAAEKALLAGAHRSRGEVPRPRSSPDETGALPYAALRPPYPGGKLKDLAKGGPPSTGLQSAGGSLRLPLHDLPGVGPLPPGSRMPFASNPLFVGREEDLRTLARHLRVAEVSAIGEVETAASSGLGGMGKTQLAVEFVHRYGRYFEGGVFWLSFAEGAAIPAEVAACGQGLGLSLIWNKLPLAEQVRRVEEFWRLPETRLLVFDNCEEESFLVRWRPVTGGSRVLVTSRRSPWSRSVGVRVVPLTTLPRAKSVELLGKFRDDLAEGEPALAGIAAELGDLPLALHLAGSYLERYAQAPFGQPAAYLESLREGSLLNHASLQGQPGGFSPTGHDLPVARTFALILDRLDPGDAVDALALALLVRASWFAPGEAIPRKLLLRTVELGEEQGEKIRAEEALRRLTKLGLLEGGEPRLEGGEPRALTIHRLVAELARSLGDIAEGRRAVGSALAEEAELLNRSGLPGRLLAWQTHLRAVAERASAQRDAIAASLYNELGFHLTRVGDFNGARPCYVQALSIWESVLGSEHPDTAVALNNLGALLRAMGDLPGARRYYEHALAMREKVLGPEDPQTAQSLNNLGALLGASGDLVAARSCCERALAIREKVLDPQHPAIAGSLNNLGRLCLDAGDAIGARAHYERALAIREKALGPEHPDTAQSLNSLGALLEDEGDLSAAQAYLERALVILIKTLGPEHPDTAESYIQVGAQLGAEGDLQGAGLSYEKALAILSDRLGPEHPRTQSAREKLANLGRLRE